MGGCSFAFKIELRLKVDLARVDTGLEVAGETVSVAEDNHGVSSVLEPFSSAEELTEGSFLTVVAALTGSGSNSIFFLSLLREKSCC